MDTRVFSIALRNLQRIQNSSHKELAFVNLSFRSYSTLPLKPNVHPSDMSPEVRMTLGKNIDKLHQDLEAFGNPEAFRLSQGIYSPSLQFKLNSPVYPSLIVNGLVAYERLLALIRFSMNIIYKKSNRKLQILPSPIPSHTLLKEDGVLCIHWKLHVNKRMFFDLWDVYKYPTFWSKWRWWNAHSDYAFKSWETKFNAELVKRQSPEYEHDVIHGLSYFAFDAKGRISHHVVDSLEPPMKESWLRLKWVAEGYLRKSTSMQSQTSSSTSTTTTKVSDK